MKKLTYVAIYLLITLPHHHSLATDDRNGIWVGTFGKKPISESLLLLSEVQLRYNSDAGSMGQTLFRGGLLKKLNDHHEVGLLFAYVQTNLLKEYRPTLQHTFQTNILTDTNVSLRSRLEFRDLEDTSVSSLRYRLMLRAQQPLSPSLHIVVWDEPFLNLTNEDWTGARTLERNRLFVGFRWLYESLSFEAGYLNQYIPRKIDISEHAFVIYLNY